MGITPVVLGPAELPGPSSELQSAEPFVTDADRDFLQGRKRRCVVRIGIAAEKAAARTPRSTDTRQQQTSAVFVAVAEAVGASADTSKSRVSHLPEDEPPGRPPQATVFGRRYIGGAAGCGLLPLTSSKT